MAGLSTKIDNFYTPEITMKLTDVSISDQGLVAEFSNNSKTHVFPAYHRVMTENDYYSIVEIIIFFKIILQDSFCLMFTLLLIDFREATHKVRFQ